MAQSAEKGEARMYKTLFATIVNQLCAVVFLAIQNQFWVKAQSNGRINYNQNNEVADVKEIVEPIAVKPPIAVFTLVIASFNHLNICAGRNNGALSDLVRDSVN